MRYIGLALGLIVLIASAPALAAGGDAKVRFGAAYISPNGGDYTLIWEDDPPYYYEESKFSADSAIGGFVGFEYLFSDLVGLDGTLLFAKHDIHEDYFVTDLEGDYTWAGTVGDISVMPLFISAHFHFLKDAPVDLYAGPTVAYVMYGDLKTNDEYDYETLKIKDDFGFGAVVGVDVPFGSSNWMFSSALRYIKTGAQVDQVDVDFEDVELDIDPLIIQVGVGVKF